MIRKAEKAINLCEEALLFANGHYCLAQVFPVTRVTRETEGWMERRETSALREREARWALQERQDWKGQKGLR